MSSITDGFKDVFLAGVGAMALGAEKSKELVDQLIAKGEITVEQGKQLNSELKHRAAGATSNLRDDMIAAQLSVMSKEEREAFAARVAEMAAAANGQKAPAAEVKAEPAEAAAPEAEAEPAPAEPASEDAAE